MLFFCWSLIWSSPGYFMRPAFRTNEWRHIFTDQEARCIFFFLIFNVNLNFSFCRKRRIWTILFIISLGIFYFYQSEDFAWNFFMSFEEWYVILRVFANDEWTLLFMSFCLFEYFECLLSILIFMYSWTWTMKINHT